MRYLILILLLLGLVLPGYAVTISSSTMSVLLPATGTNTILLDSAPNGLSGCNVTVTMANSSVGSISAITYPAWGSVHLNTNLPSNTVTFSEADFSNLVIAGATNAPLATLTITGSAIGSSQLNVAVTACDDDSGNPMNPSVSAGTVTVSQPNQIVNSGSVNFPKTVYSGVHTLPATDTSASTATLNGYVDNPITDPVVWFIMGTSNGVYGYYSASVVPNGAGNFSVKLEGLPLLSNQTYYYRAVSANGRSSSQQSFITSAITPIPTTTFGQYWTQIQSSNLTGPVVLNILWTALGDTFGQGGVSGQRIFAGIFLGGVITFLLLRQEDVTIPLQIGFMAGSILLAFVAPEFADLAYTLFVIGMIGFGYALLRRY